LLVGSNQAAQQGDQIWRILVFWTIVFSGQFYEEYEILGNSFHGKKSFISSLTKIDWATFSAIF
jgi:hypothetical protein